MNSSNPEIANAVKVIESAAPDGYGRMPIPCEIDDELHQQILFALKSKARSDFLLNQRGTDSLLEFIERMASQCLRESDFIYSYHAAQALELVLSQPDYDEHMALVAIALIHDAYSRLPEPRPDINSSELPRFDEAWTSFCSRLEHEKTFSASHFRIGKDTDGPRYTCYW
tara:strand:- start:26607 stop:27116 length:510 start_codon:yes stop_codon:yes gene_type:complete